MLHPWENFANLIKFHATLFYKPDLQKKKEKCRKRLNGYSFITIPLSLTFTGTFYLSDCKLALTMTSSTRNILEAFFKVVHVSPNQVAIELDEQTWTYGELLTNTTCVARQLPIEIGQIVYQYVDRSLEMVCGLLAIMYAGGVYCPLSPTDPPAYIQTLIDRIQGGLILVHGSTRKKLLRTISKQIPMIDLEHILVADNTKDMTEKSNCLLIQ